uniref:DUF3615 domain-containing protein n=1 Tax=Oryza barthii TaxID=65489 RepID=A0A0D3FCV4_9ORYZ
MVKVKPTPTPTSAAAKSAVAGGGEVSTETPRRSARLQQAAKKKRSRDASLPPAPAPARHRQAGKVLCAPVISDKKTVEGTINDAEIESIVLKLWNFTEEERVPYYNRLNKKRANMALAWYNENNPEDCYEFTSVLLHDVCNFCDGGVCHVHINFKARNVTTNSEELFFAELALINNVFDQYSGYTTTACCIIDGNCLGGLRNVLLNGCFLREERYDEKNCYACDEKIKHPTGSTYKGGHYAEDYLVQGIL